MSLNSNDKLLIAHRRLFEKDQPRYFVGVVDDYDDGVATATGFSFVRDMIGGRVIRKDDLRTKIFSLASGTLLVYRLPPETVIESVQFESAEGDLSVSDGQNFRMDMAELPHNGQV